MFEKNIQKNQQNEIQRRSTLGAGAGKISSTPKSGKPQNPENPFSNSGLEKSASVVVGMTTTNKDASNKLVTEVPKQSVDSLKSVFEKSSS